MYVVLFHQYNNCLNVNFDIIKKFFPTKSTMFCTLASYCVLQLLTLPQAYQVCMQNFMNVCVGIAL